MPIPQGQITTSDMWNGAEEVPLPEAPEETVQNTEENVQKDEE